MDTAHLAEQLVGSAHPTVAGILPAPQGLLQEVHCSANNDVDESTTAQFRQLLALKLQQVGQIDSQ